jgi:hypothetical protein
MGGDHIGTTGLCKFSRNTGSGKGIKNRPALIGFRL